MNFNFCPSIKSILDRLSELAKVERKTFGEREEERILSQNYWSNGRHYNDWFINKENTNTFVFSVNETPIQRRISIMILN